MARCRGIIAGKLASASGASNPDCVLQTCLPIEPDRNPDRLVGSNVEQTYDRHTYDREKAAALQALANLIDSIAHQRPSNVTELRREKRKNVRWKLMLLTGTVDLLLTALPGAQAQVQAGIMRGLAVTTKERWVNLPDVPTFKEAGFPDVTLDTEHFLLAPAATPAQLLERYTKAALAALAQDDIKKRVVDLGYAVVAGGPDAVRDRIVTIVPVFKQLIASAKIPQIE